MARMTLVPGIQEHVVRLRHMTRVLAGIVVASVAVLAIADASPTSPGPLPDPSARLLEGDDASEYWTLYIELESGHRVSQRFLLTNAGPGKHTAVAVGHLTEPGREPYRYENGRRRARWTLSEDRLYFDIAASHLDLHRPQAKLLITKEDIEIRLSFDFAKSDLSKSVPRNRLPKGYFVDILAVAAPTTGSILAPWMDTPLQTSGRTWMAHTWSTSAEAKLLDRRIDFYARGGQAAGGVEGLFYGLQLQKAGGYKFHFQFGRDSKGNIIESIINEAEDWIESARPAGERGSAAYPLPGDFRLTSPKSGLITINPAWLRFDPLDVIPNPFRWFIRRMTQPQEVWADAEIDVTLWSASESPSNPPFDAGESPSLDQSLSNSDSKSERKTEKGSATSSVTGVASITFMNPVDRR